MNRSPFAMSRRAAQLWCCMAMQERAKHYRRAATIQWRCRVIAALAPLLIASRTISAEYSPIPAHTLPTFKCVPRSSAHDFYPPSAIKRGLQGRVYAAFSIDNSGKPIRIEILRAEPDNTFVQPSLDLLMREECGVSNDSTDFRRSEVVLHASFVFELEPGGVIEQITPNDVAITVRTTPIRRREN